jgi:cobalt/nickel transport system permease protein
VWVFIPLFTIVIALPALFMWGLSSTVLFIARVAASVSFVILAALTTRHHDLLKSLRSLGIPDIFIQVLDMTYRYLSLFISLFEEMHLALKARVIERMKQGRARHWAASRLAYLFRKSVKMSEDVYLAMVARGYTGEYAANENKRRV